MDDLNYQAFLQEQLAQKYRASRDTCNYEQATTGAVGYSNAAQSAAGQNTQSITPEQVVDGLFTYHSPTSDQLVRLQEVREGAKSFARLLIRLVPSGSDRMAAIRLLRESVMTANAAIVLNGLSL